MSDTNSSIPGWVDMIDVRRSHIPGDTSWTARLIGNHPRQWEAVYGTGRVSVTATASTPLEAIAQAAAEPLPPGKGESRRHIRLEARTQDLAADADPTTVLARTERDAAEARAVEAERKVELYEWTAFQRRQHPGLTDAQILGRFAYVPEWREHESDLPGADAESETDR